jgi:hypothetical protein
VSTLLIPSHSEQIKKKNVEKKNRKKVIPFDSVLTGRANENRAECAWIGLKDGDEGG